MVFDSNDSVTDYRIRVFSVLSICVQKELIKNVIMRNITCPNCGAPVDDNVKKCPYFDTIVNENAQDVDDIEQNDIALRNKYKDLLKQGQYLAVVKLVKDEKRIGLKQAKAIVDKWRIEENATSKSGCFGFLLVIISISTSVMMGLFGF